MFKSYLSLRLSEKRKFESERERAPFSEKCTRATTNETHLSEEQSQQKLCLERRK